MEPIPFIILNYNSQPIGFFTKNLKNQGQKQEISKVSPELSD